ncbi:hypothetical protein UF75_5086 [Desulfosporosinus sp. I2]|nr:hypothetical protein UF75_5086 [Desulfosporosinus sp. I2]
MYLLIQINYITQGEKLSLNFCALSTTKGMELNMTVASQVKQTLATLKGARGP